MELSTIFFLFPLIISATTFVVESKGVKYSSNQANLGASPTNYSECSVADFANGENCVLSCNVDYTGDSSSNYVFHSSAFYYYTTDSSDMIQISHFNALPSDDISYQLTGATYFAGNYVCRIVLRSISERELQTYSHTFRIDSSTNGVELGDDCNSKQDCFALNAQCHDGECKCTGEYYMKYSKHSDTAACLTTMPLGTYGCHTDDQCQAANYEATCEDGQCIRTNHNRFSPAEVAQTTLGCFIVLALLVIIAQLAFKK